MQTHMHTPACSIEPNVITSHTALQSHHITHLLTSRLPFQKTTHASSHPHRDTWPSSRYNDFVPSESIVDQLLQLDEDEFSISLTDGLESLPSILSCIVEANQDLDNTNIQVSESSTDKVDPPTIRHAQRTKFWNEWLAAIHEELEALKAKEVYEELDSLPPGRKAVQCKWVLRIKRDQDGQISRFKARLVAKGFTQVFGQDFTFTFAPVARWESIHTVLCLATLEDYEL